MEAVARGASIDELRAKITKSDDKSKTEGSNITSNKSKIPDDLVQIQAFIRWEKAGKPNYSLDQQLVKFEPPSGVIVNNLY